MLFCPASSAFPGSRHWEAVELVGSMADPFLGGFDLSHMQLCPQHPSMIDEDLLDRCQEISPETRFRLHASVRVKGVGAHRIWDASNAHFSDAKPYWQRIGQLMKHCDGGVYSLHAGRSEYADLQRVRDNVLRMQDDMGFPVALEGLYPDKNNTWLLSSWDDYEWLLLRSGLYFALDLSHLNILVRYSGELKSDLVNAMLSSNKCLEVHISGNNGLKDSHEVIDGREWWLDQLRGSGQNFVLFNESTILSPSQFLKLKISEKKNEQGSAKSSVH